MRTRILCILGALLLSSCFEDKGNYDYVDLGEMTISGIMTDEWYEAFAFSDTLHIPVEIHSTRYTNGEEPYTYRWKLMTKNDQTKDDNDFVLDYTVSREKDLHIVPTLNAGDYYGFFIVTDTLLGVEQKVDFYVRLKTTTSEGWMILCEEAGETRLDWIVNLADTTDRIYRDLWADLDIRLGKPYGLSFAYFIAAANANRYVYTENGTFNMDRYDAHIGEDNNVKWKFGEMPDVVEGIKSEIVMSRSYMLDLLITRDKNLYVRNPLQTGAVYGFAINRTFDGKRFDVAPYIGQNAFGSGTSVIIYDETNRQFMELDDDDSNIPHPLTFVGGSAVFEAQTGRDMVYMDWMTDGHTFAVLEDPNDGEMYVYGIRITGDGNYRNYYMKLKRPDTDRITCFALHSQHHYLFYATDKSVIYRFDLENPEDEAVPVLSFPGETITVLKVNKLLSWTAFYKPWERARENRLVIGSNVNGMDESMCGIMRTYDVPDLRQPMEDKQVKYHDKLGKIVDIVYRER